MAPTSTTHWLMLLPLVSSLTLSTLVSQATSQLPPSSSPTPDTPPPPPSSSSFWNFNFNFSSSSSSSSPSPPPPALPLSPTSSPPPWVETPAPLDHPQAEAPSPAPTASAPTTKKQPPSVSKSAGHPPGQGKRPPAVTTKEPLPAKTRTPAGRKQHSPRPESLIPAMFSFGDANVNTGNDNFRNDTPLHADFPPNGRVFFRRPTGRVTDGRLIPDFLCQSLGIPLLPPYLDPKGDFRQGACFATGGSSATNNSLEPGWGYPLSKQVDLFLELHGNVSAAAQLKPPPPPSSFPFPLSLPNPFASTNESAPHVAPSLIPRLPSLETLSKALYYIQIGEVNFLQLTYQAEGFGTYGEQWTRLVSPRVQGDVLASIEDAITRLYGAGARKFLVFAVYPQACNPLVRGRANLTALNESCVSYAEPMVENYNEALSRSLWGLRGRLNDTSILLSRADKVFEAILDKPRKHGFSPSLEPCCEGGEFDAYSTAFGGCGQQGYTVCPEGERRIFWDLVHNTEAVSYLVAKETWAGSQYVHPFNLSSLAYGYRSM